MPASTGTFQWQAVADGEAIVPGGQYRMVATFRGPYNTITTDVLEFGIRVRLEAQGNTYDHVETMPPVFNSDGTQGPWVAVFYFSREADQPVQAGLNGRAIAVLLALVAGAALALAVLTTRVEKLVSTITKPINKTLDELKPILSPGSIVLAVLAIFLITRR